MARGKVPGWLWLLGAAAGGYYLLRAKAAAAILPAPAPASSPSLPAGSATGLVPPMLPGSSAPTMAQVSSAQSFWLGLTPTSPPSSGYINLPSGTQVPAADMGAGNTAMDSQGNVYISWGGQVYALSFPDAQGNWPASLVNTGG